MNRRELLQKLGGVLAVAGVVAVTTKEKALAQGGNCAPPKHSTHTISSTFMSDCSQQTIAYTVTIKETSQQCINADGTITYKIQQQAHGTAEGIDPVTGQPTGTQYVLNGTYHERSITQPYNGVCTPFSDTVRFTEMYISKGSAPNEQIVVNSTYSLDSSCQPHFSYTIDTDCHG